ncbi:hypothetical protein NPIL_484481 [Nephila pilipes]|uniref:Uncharacterized protein n=1 Tax=Nephila pilipes TaxID=299642 RepID=A0A8X6Q488_NEPPI|nr:hypothetical protein NPIL_484481 [Nephila pilipes]
MCLPKWPIFNTQERWTSFPIFYKTFAVVCWLQFSEILNLNLNYQDLLCHLLHPTLDPSHLPDMRDYFAGGAKPSQFDAEYPTAGREGTEPSRISFEYGIAQLYYLFLFVEGLRPQSSIGDSVGSNAAGFGVRSRLASVFRTNPSHLLA